MVKDIRTLQILLLVFLIVYGKEMLGWNITYLNIGVVLAVSMMVQGLFCLGFHVSIQSMKSAIITALSIGIVLRTDYTFVYGLAALFSIGFKYIFNKNYKHWVNPSLFGICFLVLFVGQLKIADLRWDWLLGLVFVSSSLCFLYSTSLFRWDVLLFVILYVLVQWGLNTDSFSLDAIFNSTFLFFVLFFYIDPATSPRKGRNRILRVVSLILLIAFIQFYIQGTYAYLWALFFVGLLTPIFQWIYKEHPFYWNETNRRVLNHN
jgi:Na+-transporting NADH:ubiquinone oxidoreductase subunit NqrB